MIKTLKTARKIKIARKTKKTGRPNKINKISIEIDFTKEDKGYTDFLNPKLQSFLSNNIKLGNNLIQTQKNKPFNVHTKNKIYLQAIPFKKWNLNQTWNEIKCKKYNDFIKTSPCNIGTNTKVVIKFKSNKQIGGFATYLSALQTGLIDQKKHIQFITALQKTFKLNPIIVHNEDVDWFHLKQYKSEIV
jgi:hypothetical protein